MGTMAIARIRIARKTSKRVNPLGDVRREMSGVKRDGPIPDPVRLAPDP
jgi:hypothetical protein